jgi:hypothetical protein
MYRALISLWFKLEKYRVTSWIAGIRFPEKTRDFSLLYFVQADYGAHPGSYPMGTKATWAPTIHILLVQMARMVDPYFQSLTSLHDIVLN